jgi:hypothetical protein
MQIKSFGEKVNPERRFSALLDSYTIKSENLSLTLVNESCHSREGGNPEKSAQRTSWIPVFTGMTKR